MNSIPDQPDILTSALEYAALGWRVFPCQPGGKRPLPGSHGFDDATTNADLIRDWWTTAPDCNVAIATGAPGPDVLDVDVKPDGSGFAALNRLKRAGLLAGASRMVRTRSGGLHCYFAGTRQRGGSLARHYLDFRSAGGYVLAPPSYVAADDKGPGGCYQLIEERASTARIDWGACKRLLCPPPSPLRRAQAGAPLPAGQLHPAIRHALTAPYTDRSAALYRLVGAGVTAGLGADAIHELAASYEPAATKYGARLPAEIDRCINKIGETK